MKAVQRMYCLLCYSKHLITSEPDFTNASGTALADHWPVVVEFEIVPTVVEFYHTTTSGRVAEIAKSVYSPDKSDNVYTSFEYDETTENSQTTFNLYKVTYNEICNFLIYYMNLTIIKNFDKILYMLWCIILVTYII